MARSKMQPCLAALLLLHLTAAAAQGSCPSAGWRGTVLASSITPSAEMEFTTTTYYTSKVLPAAGPALVGLIFTLLTLIVYFFWRLTLCKVTALLFLVGLIVGCALGMSRVNPELVNDTSGAVGTVQAYLVSVTMALSLVISDVSQLGTAANNLQNLYSVSVAVDTNGIASSLTSMRDQFADVESQLGDVQTKYLASSDGPVKKYDKWRQIGMYSFLGVIIGVGLLLNSAILLNWPAPVKVLTTVLLLLLIFIWILVLIMTLVLKVGADGCANAEAQLQQRLGSADMKVALQYYLQPDRPSITVQQVLLAAFNTDINSILASIGTAQSSLQMAASNARGAGNNALAAAADADAALCGTLFTDITNQLLVTVSYNSVHPVYATVKKYACCNLLNFIRYLWVSLIVSGIFGLLICWTAMVVISHFDELPDIGCCAWYKKADLTADIYPMLPGSKGEPQLLMKEERIEIMADGRGNIPSYNPNPSAPPVQHFIQSGPPSPQYSAPGQYSAPPSPQEPKFRMYQQY